MKCDSRIKKTTYGSQAYCSRCGMDLDVNPVIARKRGTTKLFCCEDCAKGR